MRQNCARDLSMRCTLGHAAITVLSVLQLVTPGHVNTESLNTAPAWVTIATLRV